MNSTLSKVVVFAVGAAIGSAVTWKITKTKYERIAREEIAEMREYVRKKRGGDVVTEKIPEDTIVKDDRAKFNKIVRFEQYSVEPANNEEKGGEQSTMDENRPYVIDPEDFGVEDDYDTVSLSYYTDGVLEDERGNVVPKEDIDDIVGEDFADHFGEFVDDAVYVRNDELKIDYEILLDVRSYEEARSVNSHMDDE